MSVFPGVQISISHYQLHMHSQLTLELSEAFDTFIKYSLYFPCFHLMIQFLGVQDMNKVVYGTHLVILKIQFRPVVTLRIYPCSG